MTAARAHADEAFRLAQTEYRAGAISFLDLLSAEQTQVAADQQLAASDQLLAVDQVAVFQALGGGWEQALGDRPAARARRGSRSVSRRSTTEGGVDARP